MQKIKKQFVLVTLRASRAMFRPFLRLKKNQSPPNWDKFPKLLTIRHTADLLDVHPNTLRSWDQQGRLPAVRLGTRQDRRYERERVKELWRTIKPAASEGITAPWGFRPRSWWFLNHRWLRPLVISITTAAVIVVIGQLNLVVASQPVSSSVMFTALDCSGWQSAGRAGQLDLSASAGWSDFSSQNSAYYDVNQYRVSSRQNQNISTGNLDSPASIFNCAGFTDDYFPSNGVVSRANLIVSFASRADGGHLDGYILETSPDGNNWTTRGVIPVRSEHYGQIVYDLGTALDRNALLTLHVRLSPDIDIATPSATAWLDGLAIQAEVITPVAVDAKKNSQAEQELNRLIAFSQATYTSTETPVVTVPKHETKKLLFLTTKRLDWTLNEVTLVDSNNKATTPQFTTSDLGSGANVSTSINFQTANLHPGKYTVKVTMRNNDGGQATIEKEFLWGVVVLDFSRPNPRPGDEVNGEIGVLDDGGTTICDALIEVKVTNPRGQVSTFNEKRKNLHHSGVCVDKGVTNQADYSFKFTPEAVGTYHISLIAKTKVGERRVEENLLVDDASKFDVQRSDFSSRIYPPAPYSETIAVTPANDYRGIVTERVPADFVISNLVSQGIVVPPTGDETAQLIQWPVNWTGGQTYYLRYTYDAPYISPAVFRLGPMTIEANTLSGADWTESRPWQIASDAVTPVGDDDFIASQADVLAPLQTAYKADAFIDLKVYKSGYTFKPGKVKQGLAEAKPAAVTKIEVIGPRIGEAAVTTTSKISSKNGRELEVVHLVPGREFYPGQYTVNITVSDGTITSIEQRTFSWGVLAVNLRRSIEQPNSPTTVGLAVLTNTGRTNCEADVTLDVTNPTGNVKTFKTSDGTITKNPACVDKGVTNDFDYAVAYTTGGAGTYALHMTADQGDGPKSIDDTFEVRETVDFDIERTDFSMRIYPIANYPTKFTVISHVDYHGTVRETVPASFGLTDISDGGVALTSGADQVITWNVDWQAGETHTLGYTIDFPDISPEFYLLGPLMIGDSTGPNGAVFQEARPWQIASDEAGSQVLGGRVYTAGFELNTTTAGVEYSTNINTPTISNSTFRSGAYALRTNPSSSTQGMYQATTASNDLSNIYFGRAYLYVATAPTAPTTIMAFRTYAGAAEVSIRLNTDLTLELWDEYNGGGTPVKIGSSSSAITAQTWARIELRYGGSWDGTVAGRLNGVEFAHDYNRTWAAGVAQFAIGVIGASTSADLFWDDVAVNKNGGGTTENWPGEGKVVYLRPNGLGTNTAWTGAYTNVNETTPDDVSSYMYTTAANQLEDLTLQNSSDVGIGANDQIRFVNGNFRFANSGTSARTVKLTLFNGSNSDVGTSRSTSTTTWYTNVVSTINILSSSPNSYDLPGATQWGAWTATDLDNSYAQIASTTWSSGAAARVSTVWVAVEYVPASGGRLYSSGFELQDTTAGAEWTTKDGSPTISTTTYRGGVAALRVSSLSSTARQGLDYTFKSANSTGPFFVRTYLYIATPPSAENRIIDLRDSSGNARAYITMDADRKLKLYDEDGAIGSLSSALSASTWYRVELKFDASAAAGSHIVEGKIDGTAFATGSSQSISTGVTQLGVGGNLNSESQTTGEWFFDDVAINQNVGSAQNSYPGDGRIAHLRPDGNGDSGGNWTPTAGCSAGSSYECVDEVTPNDATDYLMANAASTYADEFTLASTSSAGIGSSDTINLVQVGARFNNGAAAATAFAMRLKDATDPVSTTLAGNFIFSNKIITSSTTWYENSATSPQLYPMTAYTRPEQSTVWTPTVLDDTQIGIMMTNTTTATESHVTAQWLLVEYVPPPGVNISGTVYTNAAGESTVFDCSGTALTLHASINGGTNSDGTCTAANGTFSFTVNAPAVGNPVVLYIDSGETEKATSVTLAADATSNISLNLIQDRLFLSHEAATVMSNSALGTGDNGNAGIRYAVSSGNLTVEDGMELHILTGKSFAPGGTVTTSVSSDGTDSVVDGDVHIPVTATLTMGTNALSVGGDLTNAGTLSLSTGQVITMTATGSGFTLTSGGQSLKGLTFNGSGGAWTNSGALTVSESWIGTAGAFTQVNSTTITANGSAFSLANGFSWTKASTGANLILENATNLTFTDSNTAKQNLGVVQIGASPGTVTLASDMSADTVTIPTGDTFNTKGYEVTTTGAFACNGTCALDLTSTGGESDGTILDVGGDFTMSATATFTPSTDSKVFMNSTAGTDANRTMTTGGKAYYDVELKNAGATNDDITISGTPFDLNGNLTLTDGQVRLDTNDPNVTLNGNVAINANATLTKADNGTATWTFDGATTPVTWTDGTAGGGQDLGLVSINGTTKTVNLASSAKATTLTIAGSQIFGLGSSGYTFTLTASGTPLSNSGTLSVGTNSIFKYIGTSTTNIEPETYDHLTIAPASGSPTYYIDQGSNGQVTANGNFVLGDGANAVTAENNGDFGIIVGGDLTISASATYSYGSNNNTSIGGSFTNSGTLTDNGAGLAFTATTTGKTISGDLTGSNAPASLWFNGSGGEWTSNVAIETFGIIMSAGTFTGAGDVTVSYYVTGSAGVINRTGGTFTIRPSSSQSFGPTTASNSWTFNNLTFGNSHASTGLTITKQSCATCGITVNGVLQIGKTGDTAVTTLNAGDATWTLAGTGATPLSLLGSPTAVFTAGTSTVTYNGVNGSGNINITTTTYYSLGCSPVSTETCDVTASLTVGQNLTVGSNGTLAIASGQTLIQTAGTVTLTGTISGAGILEYQSATAFPATGTITSILRMNAINNAQSLACSGGGRTFGGAVEFYNGHASTARTITLCNSGSETASFSSNVTINGAGGGAITLEANTNDPAVNVTGNLTTGTSGGGAETISLGGGTWTVAGDATFTNSTTTNYIGGTLLMNGDTKSLNGNNQYVGNLTISPIDGGTINVVTSNMMFYDTMSVAANKTLNVNSGAAITGGTFSDVAGTGTITGDGTFATYQTGVISLPVTTLDVKYVYFMDSYGDQTIPARSYSKAGGVFRCYNWNSNTNTHILGAGTFDILGDLYIVAASTGPVAVNGTTYNPTVNIGGNLYAYSTATAQTINTGTGTWTVAGNVTLTSLTVNATSGNTVKMTGTTKTLTSAGNSLYNFEVASGSTNNVTMSGATTVNNNLTITSGSLTAPTADFKVGGNWTNAGTFVEGTGTVTLNGTISAALNSGCSDTDSCASQNFYNLIIDKTDGDDADDNVTLTTNGINVANTLTITDGELIQGALNVRVEGSTAVSIASAGKWNNVSTGDLKLGGTFVNAGTAVFNSSSGSQCTNATDDIVITSTVGGTQRAWSGAGTFTIYNVSATDMTDSSITAYTSTLSNTTWTVGSCGISVSGTVYQASSETTVFDCDAVNLALRVSVNGAAATSGTCSAVGGTFTVANVTTPSGADIPIVVYTDNTANPSQKTTMVTLSSGTGNITGLSLIIDRVVVTQESATAITNAHLATADNADAGIRYAVSTGALTVEDGMELHVLAGKTFTPGGTVTTSVSSDGTDSVVDGDVHIPATATMTMGTSALSVGGDLTSAGTLSVSAGQTTTMTATGSGFILTPNGATMQNVTFNGASGGWTTSGTLTVANNLTLTDGAVTVNGNTTVATTLTVASGKTLTINSGKSITLSKTTSGTTLSLSGTIDGAGTLIYQNSLTNLPSTGTLSSDLILRAVTSGLAVTTRTYGGDVTCEGNVADYPTFTFGTGNPIFNGNLTVTELGNSVMLDGTANPTVTLAGDFNMAVSMLVKMGSGVWTVSGNFYATSILHNSGTLKMNGVGKTLTTNSSPLYNFELTGGSVTIVNALTVNDLTVTTGTLTAPSAGTLIVNGNFTNNASFTHNSGTVTMAGSGKNITGSSSTTFNNLTINDNTTVAAGGSDHTVAGTLAVASGKTLTIGTGRTVTASGSTNVSWGDTASTITGGTITFNNTTSGGPGTSGVISSVVRYDASNGNIPAAVVDARTYGDDVEMFSNVADTARSITLAGGTYAVSGSFKGLNGASQNNTLTVSAATGYPAVSVTGNVTFTKTGSGGFALEAGSGIWTVTGNLDFSNVSVTHNSGTFLMNGSSNLIGSNTGLNNVTISGSANTVTETGTINIVGVLTMNAAGQSDNDTLSIGGIVDIWWGGSIAFPGSGTDVITGNGTLVVENNGFTSASGTVSCNVIFVGSEWGTVTIPARTFSDATKTVTLRAGGDYTETISASGTTTVQGNLVIDASPGSPIIADFSGAGTVTVGGNVSAVSGASIVFRMPGTWNSSGNFNLTNVTTFTPGSGTLMMDGASGSGTLTSAGKTFLSVDLNPATEKTVTLANATLTVSGYFVMRGSGVIANGGSSTTVVMTGASTHITANNGTLPNLTITGSNVGLQDGGLTVSGLLTINDGGSLFLNGQSLTLSGTSGTSLNFNSTGAITGTGTLIYQNTTAFPTGGTISAPLRMDATNNNQSMSARTYGGQVEIYNNSSTTNRTVTVGTATSQTLTFSSNLYVNASDTADTIIAVDTYNPTIAVTGDLNFTGSGGGSEIISAGTGTWTVSGNVDFSDGIYASKVATVYPSWDQSAYYQNYFDPDSGCIDWGGAYNCSAPNESELVFGINDLSQNCTYGGGGGSYYENTIRAGMHYHLDSIASSSVITTATMSVVGVTTANQAITIGRSVSDDASGSNCLTSAMYTDINIVSSYGSVTPWNSGRQYIDFSRAAVQDIQSRLSAGYIGIGMKGDELTKTYGTLYSSEYASGRPMLLIGYAASETSPTLIMSGTDKSLTTGGNGLYNVTFSGSGTTTLSDDVAVYGNAVLNNTISSGSTMLTMAGAGTTLTGGAATVNNLTIDPITAGTVTLSGSDLTASGTLTVASGDTLDIATGRVLTNTGVANTAIAGTVSSAGTGYLRFTDTSGGPGTGGTLSAAVRYDATSNNIANTTFDARTYGGSVELYANSGTAKSITAAAGNYIFSSTLTTTAGGAGVVTADMSSATGTVAVAGALSIGATTALSAPAALSVAGNFTNSGTFTHNSGQVTLSGSSQQVVSGTLTGVGGQFYGLTVTNASGSDPDTSPSVIFADSAQTAGTFTVSTANTKLRFTASETYTFQNIDFDGQATGTRVFLRSSSSGTQWKINVAGTRSVSNTAVRDSNACDQPPDIDASDGTNLDEVNNQCWLINSLTVTLSGDGIAFGSITSSIVAQSSMTSTVTTSAPNGYVSFIKDSQDLTSSENTIADAAGSITNGTAGYGVSTSKSGQIIVQTTDSCSSSAGTFNASGVTTSFQQYSSSSTNVVSEETTLCFLVTASAITPAGVYSTTVTLVTTARF